MRTFFEDSWRASENSQNRLIGWNLAQEQDDNYEAGTRKSVWLPEGKSHASEIWCRYFQEPEIMSLAGAGPSLEKGLS